jgi:ribosomal protein L37E
VSCTVSADGRSITCEVCGRTSYNLHDVANRYCGYCRSFYSLRIEPHRYLPSTLHMGDCAICGHLQGDAIHRIECNYPDCDGGPATGYCHTNCRAVLASRGAGRDA